MSVKMERRRVSMLLFMQFLYSIMTIDSNLHVERGKEDEMGNKIKGVMNGFDSCSSLPPTICSAKN